jgi:hypothetical protein
MIDLCNAYENRTSPEWFALRIKRFQKRLVKIDYHIAAARLFLERKDADQTHLDIAQRELTVYKPEIELLHKAIETYRGVMARLMAEIEVDFEEVQRELLNAQQQIAQEHKEGA